MSKLYTLIGPEAPIEPWVINYVDVRPELPQITHHSRMITACRWPILFYHQIPRRFLEADPGFPILLRAKSLANLPEWIYPPDRYEIKTPKIELSESTLFLCYQKDQLDWDILRLKHPASKHYWMWLGDPNESVTKFPKGSELDLLDVIHFKNVIPDLVVDLDFGLIETYGIVQLHCLNMGASFLDRADIPRKLLRMISTSYGAQIKLYC